jgi:hypothetical protein
MFALSPASSGQLQAACSALAQVRTAARVGLRAGGNAAPRGAVGQQRNHAVAGRPIAQGGFAFLALGVFEIEDVPTMRAGEQFDRAAVCGIAWILSG